MEDYLKGVAEEVLRTTTTWDVSIEDQAGLAEILKYLLDVEREGKKVFAPVTVHTECPYAAQVEFGTGPAKKAGTDEGRKKRMDSMVKWVRARGLAPSGKEEKKAEELIRVIIHNGIAPTPQFRSAVNTVMDRNNADANYLGSDLATQRSIMDLANEILDAIEENMADVPHVSESDPLARSFKADVCPTQTAKDDGQVDVPIASSGSDASVTEDMWRNEESGRNGKRPHHKNR